MGEKRCLVPIRRKPLSAKQVRRGAVVCSNCGLEGTGAAMICDLE